MKIIFFLLIFWSFSSGTYCQADKVTINRNDNGIKLKVNGNDFIINGMNWDYFPIGTNYEYNLWNKQDSIIQQALNNEMSLLKNMGVNVIRVYTGIPKKWIEYIYTNYGIYTMLNHTFGRYGLTIKDKWVANTEYADADTREFILKEVKQLAADYKDTKGLLLFLLGNENNYGLVWEGAETKNIPVEDRKSTRRKIALYKLFDEAAVVMKTIDQSHPIALCNGDLQFLDLIAKECKNVDILGINVYRGVSFGDVFERVKKEYGKPVLFTEFGSDAFNAITKKENQNGQAAIVKENWKEIYANAAGMGKSGNCIGGFTFQFSDGWWKYAQTSNLSIHDDNASWSNGGYSFDFIKGKNNMNEEWFGICAKEAANTNGLYQLFPRSAYYTLKDVHRFNPYTAGSSLTTLSNYFNSIKPTNAVLKPGKSKVAYSNQSKKITAKEILGNTKYQAISYGGFRATSRDIEPTIAQITEDLKLLSAMNIKVLRTYNVHNKEVSNLLKAISALKKKDASFEMYVMLGAWIDCKNAFTALSPDHTEESEHNSIEIAEAVRLANQYPDIVKIIAVGNEAMVKWAASYYVQPVTILKWVNYLQELKKQGKLSKDLWITSSDNFASWGGGGKEYHVEALTQLIKAVDYVSVHTYPMHDTHYNPKFWGIAANEKQLSEQEKINAAMLRARDYAVAQYKSVYNYVKLLGVEKPIHIGETGWATASNELYGNAGSKATDEYKSAIYYQLMREWANREGISLFYFEAFDEQWKDSKNPLGSENHFGLINLLSQAKYTIWDLVDQGVFKGLTRDGKPITKTYNGKVEALLLDVKMPAQLIKN
jgi:exo-beta-1,3-glucanase (GH17 family)